MPDIGPCTRIRPPSTGRFWTFSPARSGRGRRPAVQREMKTLLIVYASVTGGARQMAEAALRGAQQEPGVRTRMLHADAAGAQDVLEADGYIFVSPEMLAALAGQMKWFFD